MGSLCRSGPSDTLGVQAPWETAWTCHVAGRCVRETQKCSSTETQPRARAAADQEPKGRNHLETHQLRDGEIRHVITLHGSHGHRPHMPSVHRQSDKIRGHTAQHAATDTGHTWAGLRNTTLSARGQTPAYTAPRTGGPTDGAGHCQPQRPRAGLVCADHGGRGADPL